MFGSIVLFMFILQTILKITHPVAGLAHWVMKFFDYFNIDCMLIGALFALLDYQKHPIMQFLKNNFLFYSVLGLTVLMLAFGIFIPFVQYQAYSVLFGIIILNLATNPNCSINMEYAWLKYLGDISYGLYMYHPLAIATSLLILSSTGNFSNLLLYPLVFALTIAVASLSYRYFESYFLKIKNKFSIVIVKNKT